MKLWKSDSGSAGTLWGAHEDDEDGSKEEFEYSSTANKKNVIWGRPCYYWVIPALDTVISIKFDYSLCDAEMFENFVTKCITNRIDHPKRVKRHTKNGYVRLSSEDNENSNLSYRFSTQLKSMNTSNAEMQKLAARVTHIINRETVLVSSKDDRKTWTKRFNKCVPFLKPPLNHDKRKIEVRAEARPSAAEIKRIIEANAKENRKPSDWENVGFETEDGKTTWADKYRLSDTIRIDKTNGKLITAESLCKSLQSNRNRYTHNIERELALINKNSR